MHPDDQEKIDFVTEWGRGNRNDVRFKDCTNYISKSRSRNFPFLMQDFDFSIRYRKGSMNTVADALSRIKEVNILSFTKIKFDLLDHLRGKYLDDNYFSKYWTKVVNLV